MIQRSLIRASRQIAPRLSQRAFVAPARPPPSSSRLSSLHPASTRLSSRWYSSDVKPPNGENKSGEASKPSENAPSSSDANAKEQPPPEIQVLKADIEARNKEILDLKDKYLRSVADYRNLQDRTKREVQAARDYALQKFAQDLISSIDTFEHALSSVPTERLQPRSQSTPEESTPEALLQTTQTDLQSLHKGLQLTETMLLDTLKRHGLVRFDPAEEGARFDPNLHEAVFQAPVPGKEDGTVFVTQQKGFMLNGRVIRAPKVGVVKNS